jgi:hypothetical protein
MPPARPAATSDGAEGRMRIKARTVVLSVLAVLVIGVLAVITSVGWQVGLGPDARPVTDRKFEATEARLARGKYLVEGPLACFHCHSEHDLSNPEYPIVQARKGAGWVMPIPELNNIASRNITPDPETGIGAGRTTGNGRFGRASRRIGPLPDHATRTRRRWTTKPGRRSGVLAPFRVKNVVPTRQLPGPLEYIVKTIPKPLTTPQPSHPAATPEERGKYLVTLADCRGCHTPTDDQGIPLPGLDFAGGGRFSDPGRNMQPVFSLNITQDPSGISHYDEPLFIQTLHLAGWRLVNHIMPFEFFRNMTEADVRDIFAYLKSVPPLKHRVSNTDPPAPCPVCNQTHGLGEMNKAEGR